MKVITIEIRPRVENAMFDWLALQGKRVRLNRGHRHAELKRDRQSSRRSVSHWRYHVPLLSRSPALRGEPLIARVFSMSIWARAVWVFRVLDKIASVRDRAVA